jgi:hypothetical protein
VKESLISWGALAGRWEEDVEHDGGSAKLLQSAHHPRAQFAIPRPQPELLDGSVIDVDMDYARVDPDGPGKSQLVVIDLRIQDMERIGPQIDKSGKNKEA